MTAQGTPIALAAASSGTVVGTPATLRGFWLVTSAAATVTIYDNASAASGTVLAQWTTAGVADKQAAFADGARCAKGIYVNVSAGTISGTVNVG